MKILVLFDIDGTILQMKNGISKKIFSNYLEKIFGSAVHRAEIPDFHGMTDLQIIREIAKSINFPIEDVEDRIYEIWSDLSADFSKYCIKENINLMPGILKLIELLEKDEIICLGLLTGNIKQNAYSKLNTYELGSFFPVGAFGDDNHDRNVLAGIAINRANIYYGETFSSKNTVIIGDSFRDIECGKKNQIPVIAVSTGGASKGTLTEHNPEFLYDDFSDYNKVHKTIIKHFELEYEENNNSN